MEGLVSQTGHRGDWKSFLLCSLLEALGAMLGHFSHFFRIFSHFWGFLSHLGYFDRFFSNFHRFLVDFGRVLGGFGDDFSMIFRMVLEKSDFTKSVVFL